MNNRAYRKRVWQDKALAEAGDRRLAMVIRLWPRLSEEYREAVVGLCVLAQDGDALPPNP